MKERSKDRPKEKSKEELKDRPKDRYFFKLLRITKLPWMLLISTCLVSVVHTILNLLLPDIPSLLYTFVGSFVIIFTYDWRLVVLEAVLLPILFVITWLNGRLQFKWHNRIQEKLASLSAFLAERLVNIPMKLFVQENVEEQKGLEAVKNLYDSQKKYVFRLSGIQFLVQFETVLQSILVVVGGAAFIRLAVFLFDGTDSGQAEISLERSQEVATMLFASYRRHSPDLFFFV